MALALPKALQLFISPECAAQLLFTVSVTPVIHNWWDIKDQNAQLVELIMFFKVTFQP